MESFLDFGWTQGKLNCFQFQASQNQVAFDWQKSCQYFRFTRQQKAPKTRKTTTTYKQPPKQVKTKTYSNTRSIEQSFHNPTYLVETHHTKHLHWSFSALPSVSHFTLRLTKRLARILITAHLGGNVGQFRAEGWGGFGSLQCTGYFQSPIHSFSDKHEHDDENDKNK